MVEFKLTETQYSIFLAWSSSHIVSLDTIGTQYTFSFTPTSIGTSVRVTDLVSLTTIDLTEYNTW
jgi:hypothetical protein